MQKAKQCHSDGSTCVVSYTQDTWKIEVLVPRPKGSTVLKIADVRVRNLEEAILLCQQAMKEENPAHVCDAGCERWTEF
jgi:hypothetical protein